MENIRIYIENIFSGIVDNDETRRIKGELIQANEEKYLSYLQKGMNENEAFGRVIAEFGSIEELKAELGYEELDPDEKRRKEELIEDYMKFQKRFGLMIATGVGLIFVGIIAAMLVTSESPEAQAIAFFIPLAVAVGIFITAGIQDDAYNKQLRANKLYEYMDESELRKEKYRNGEGGHPYQGVIYTLALAIYLYLGLFCGNWHPSWLIFIVAAAVDQLMNVRRKKK